jgi:hypothetical protein
MTRPVWGANSPSGRMGGSSWRDSAVIVAPGMWLLREREDPGIRRRRTGQMTAPRKCRRRRSESVDGRSVTVKPGPELPGRRRAQNGLEPSATTLRCVRWPTPSTIRPPLRCSGSPRPASSTSASPGSHDGRRSPLRDAGLAVAVGAPGARVSSRTAHGLPRRVPERRA